MSKDIPYSGTTYWSRLLLCLYMVPGCLLLLTFFFPAQSFADNNPDYAELSIYLSVQDVGGEELPAIIRGREVYLSVADLFDFLKIKNNYLSGSDSISGFFISEQATFLIDNFERRIFYQDKIYDLDRNDLIQTGTNLYLRSG